ncbi:MAG: hypothetical protein KDJ70_05505 [Candidatus Competibacteraceae bacterium]|nr:hypothetical protein [Candidatus Competibacteraceae bacterium]
MKRTRREVLQLLSGAMAMPLIFISNSRLLAAASISRDLDPQELTVLDYFTKSGFTRLPAMDLITGHDFNDGLRYDDTPQSYPPGRSVRIQDCMRMEDLPRKGEPGILPYFHILSLSIEKPAFRGELLTTMLDYLVTEGGLDPKKLVLVSTDRFRPFLPLLETRGIEAGRFVERNRAEAMAKGDGSGYFNPLGHPYVTGQYTVSLHYALNAGGEKKLSEYPLPSHLEIAEVAFDPDLEKSPPREMGGIGLERLLLAQGKAIDDFDTSRKKGVAAVEAEAKRRMVALPKAYRRIST